MICSLGKGKECLLKLAYKSCKLENNFSPLFFIKGMVQLSQDANAKSTRIKEKFLSPNVTEELIGLVPNHFLGTDTSCIQMFLCKIEPAFWSMQITTRNYSGISLRRSLNSNLNKWLDQVYQKLPDLKSLRTFGGRCHEKFPKCQLLNII